MRAENQKQSTILLLSLCPLLDDQYLKKLISLCFDKYFWLFIKIIIIIIILSNFHFYFSYLWRKGRQTDQPVVSVY